jgi:alanine-glyoxylate transaminase/serine-glyoxylate transaminase/serine-pyruvate transaminase
MRATAEPRSASARRRASRRSRFAPAALEKRVACRSFYLDLGLLEDYWVKRKYHHTMSASLIYALDEGRWPRSRRKGSRHGGRGTSWPITMFASAVDAMGLGLLPPAGERLKTLNATRIPSGVDDAAVRKEAARDLQHRDRRRHGAARRQDLAYRADGRGSHAHHVQLLVSALEAVVTRSGHTMTPGAGSAAAQRAMSAPIPA